MTKRASESTSSPIVGKEKRTGSAGGPVGIAIVSGRGVGDGGG